MVMVIAGAQRDLEALKPCPGRAKLKPPPRGFPVMISCDCGVRGMRYEMPGETRSRPAFTPCVHAARSPSTQRRSRPPSTHLSTRSRAPFTHSVHAFTRSAHPFTRTGTPVRRTGRVSLPSATTTSASASASASAAGGSAHPAAPACRSRWDLVPFDSARSVCSRARTVSRCAWRRLLAPWWRGCVGRSVRLAR